MLLTGTAARTGSGTGIPGTRSARILVALLARMHLLVVRTAARRSLLLLAAVLVALLARPDVLIVTVAIRVGLCSHHVSFFKLKGSLTLSPPGARKAENGAERSSPEDATQGGGACAAPMSGNEQPC